MNAHDAELDMIAVYALGALRASEAATVRAHIKSCDECRAEYDELRPAVNALAVSAQASPAPGTATYPSDLLKARVMKTVRAESDRSAERPRRSVVWPAYIVAAASIVLALWATGSNMLVKSQMQQSQDQVALLSQQVKSANGTIAGEKTMVADLMNADSHRFAVANGEVVMHGERIYIAMHGMPMPPKGHVYQAWMLHSGAKEMTPGTTFMPDPERGGVAVVSLPPHAKTFAAVAVSIEPEGGSKAPTTKPEFIVKLT
ncbi:MAG: anti-sigma factor [Candidatus Eremiobacteraeota bacterium]|nr:anti-sigma factor [Candidatus Eremiobacteraeota bacterium]